MASKRHVALGAVTVLVALAAGAASVHTSRAAVLGSRPAPSASGLPIFFKGSFADSRWHGNIGLVVSADGSTLQGVDGIAPGPCEDKDFGHLEPGKDGATGPVINGFAAAPIAAGGSFKLSERRSGQRRPFKPASSLKVSGTFAGATVRGRVVASTSTPFDVCTASVSFTAHRALH